MRLNISQNEEKDEIQEAKKLIDEEITEIKRILSLIPEDRPMNIRIDAKIYYTDSDYLPKIDLEKPCADEALKYLLRDLLRLSANFIKLTDAQKNDLKKSFERFEKFRWGQLQYDRNVEEVFVYLNILLSN